MKKKFNPRIKARLRKNRQVLSKNIDNFFGWVKGAKLVELKECNIEEDPVRPELDNNFRTGYGRSQIKRIQSSVNVVKNYLEAKGREFQ